MPKYYFPQWTIMHLNKMQATIQAPYRPFKPPLCWSSCQFSLIFSLAFIVSYFHSSCYSSIFSVFHASLPRLVSHQEHNVLGSLLKFKELIPVYLSFHVSGLWPATLERLMGDSVLCVLETSWSPAALDENPKLPKKRHSPVTTFGYIVYNSCL